METRYDYVCYGICGYYFISFLYIIYYDYIELLYELIVFSIFVQIIYILYRHVSLKSLSNLVKEYLGRYYKMFSKIEMSKEKLYEWNENENSWVMDGVV
jgi:hypothetical protein